MTGFDSEVFLIDGIRCLVYRRGTSGPVIYLASSGREEVGTLILKEMDQCTCANNFILVEFQVENWNRDLSPWPGPPVFGTEAFDGCGKDTLVWLEEKCIPYIEQIYGKSGKRYLAGYSLAGLFALWAAYETRLFDGIASCSGSLWFPEWDNYITGRSLAHPCIVYLSLGDREEKTRNRLMSSVGECTRLQESVLKNDANAREVLLQWNKGGHFNEPNLRLTKGLVWLLDFHDKSYIR